MNPFLRQKACIPCATSKRRCDRQLPECHRCLARDVDCSYPLSKRKRPYPVVSDLQDRSAPDSTRDLLPADDNAHQQIVESGSMGLPDGGILDGPIYDLLETDPQLWLDSSFTAPDLFLQAQRSNDITALNNHWFLEEETWELQSVYKDANNVVDLEQELKLFIDAVDKIMRAWVTTGSNGFIHPRLYRDGMPSCLQDAFLVLSAYTGRAAAVEETILEISEQKSVMLIAGSKDTPNVASSSQLLHFLAEFQALFIHCFARLYSGSIRRRTTAESHLHVLRRRLLRLNTLVRTFQKDQQSQTHTDTHHHLPGRKPIAPDFDSEYDSCSEQWHLWVLTESIRRTHLLAECWMDAYEALTAGEAPCRGTPMVTARSGLWDARSAVEWLERTRAQGPLPLLVASLHPEAVMSRCDAGEVDEFVKAVWQVIVGRDRMKHWHSRKTMF